MQSQRSPCRVVSSRCIRVGVRVRVRVRVRAHLVSRFDGSSSGVVSLVDEWFLHKKARLKEPVARKCTEEVVYNSKWRVAALQRDNIAFFHSAIQGFAKQPPRIVCTNEFAAEF